MQRLSELVTAGFIHVLTTDLTLAEVCFPAVDKAELKEKIQSKYTKAVADMVELWRPVFW